MAFLPLRTSGRMTGPPRVAEKLERLIRWYLPTNGENGSHSGMDEQPLRAELYSVEQLERHAKIVAESHQLAKGRARDRLIARLDDNERVLVRTYDMVTAAVEKNRRIAPAAEWLLDNFYVIEEQIRTARRHLPRSYSRELPRLASGSAAGFPRVYGIALEIISHVDGGVDAVGLNAFIAAYQTVTPLTLGELWAVPIMLRLALIENLRRVALRVAAGRRDRDSANEWAERMVAVVEQNPTDLILVLADMARANPPLTSAFLAELTRHLHGQSPHFAFAQSWLEHRLSEQGLRLAPLVQMESQVQATDQVSIGNSITSLRFLNSTDWREFVEAQSVVEKVLRTDPPDVYATMDFGTRDRYRHAVEEIAKRSRLSEYDVAHKAVQLAQVSFEDQPEDRSAHVGYHLIDRGRSALERMADMRRPLRVLVSKLVRRYPLFVYLSGVLLITAAVVAALLEWAARRGFGWELELLLIPIVFCTAQFAISAVNWLVTFFVGARPLPRMDFKDGVPAKHCTMVAVPTMLSSPAAIDDLIEGLEIRYLANRDKHIHFALLTDLKDAPQETMPEDEALIRQAREGIESLNRKYEQDAANIFFLLHRPRRWNEQEGVWMGYERKRGKLAELNAVIRGAPPNRFAEIVGDRSILPRIRYVIALDTDTQLPRDAARELIGAMAHPLNRPVFDAERGRVTQGYSILQPRVGVSLPSASRSWFVRLFAADAGLDPYTRVVSDVYQDLFGEGSFIGKGIYDVAAFERLCGNFPDNLILSHDLIESAYVRSGLVSDVELYEEHLSRYSADVSRRSRWIRGDWQIAQWLLPRVPTREARWARNPICALSWWKIFDNLRRSLVPAATLTLLVLSWLLLTTRLATAMTLFVVAIVAAVPLIAAIVDLLRKPRDMPWSAHLRAFAIPLARQVGQMVFTLITLPYDAYVNLHAVGLTLMRMAWTRRKMLEWQTSGDAERNARVDLPGSFLTMWVAPAFAVAVFALVAVLRPQNLPVSAPLLGLWLLSPIAAWWLSRPIAARPPVLSAQQRAFLGKLARKTWRYFEAFVTAEENWLPPDNVQEHPASKIASRTSPTNIGMALLANLSAHDFGYSSAAQLIDRTHKTLATLGKMERSRRHFYNWYDTRSLKPLHPLYISTVDSGNLAGHLLVLRRGLVELCDAKILPSKMFSGIRDTVRVLRDDVAKNNSKIRYRMEWIETELEHPPQTLSAAMALLQRLSVAAAEIAATSNGDGEFAWWTAALDRAVADHRDDLVHIAPWTSLPPPPEHLVGSSRVDLQACKLEYSIVSPK